MPKRELDKWTIVQHSGFGYGGKSEFARATETRNVFTAADKKLVEKAGGILFDSYMEAEDFSDQVNGISGEGTFLQAQGTFSKHMIDQLRIYVPVRKTEVIG